MKHTQLSLTSAALFAALLAAASCRSAGTVDHGAQPAPAMSAEDWLKETMRLGTPGLEHKELMKDAGTWDSTYKMRMAPDQPWMEFHGTATGRPLLDGRYLWQDIEWSMPDPMSGQTVTMNAFQILGFDISAGEYTALWADSWSTWLIESRGKRDAQGVLRLAGTMKDAAGQRPFRMEMRADGEDARRITLYDTIPPAGEVVVMEIAQTRRK